MIVLLFFQLLKKVRAAGKVLSSWLTVTRLFYYPYKYRNHLQWVFFIKEFDDIKI